MYTETKAYQDDLRIKRLREVPESYQHLCRWMKWRAISDRVISHPQYRYNGYPVAKRLLLNLARVAQIEMAHANRQFWGYSDF
jgi:hypothetical protein